MPNPHAQQAAALLAQADEVKIPPGEEPFERRADETLQRKRDIRQEALVEAVLAVAFEITMLPHNDR